MHPEALQLEIAKQENPVLERGKKSTSRGKKKKGDAPAGGAPYR